MLMPRLHLIIYRLIIWYLQKQWAPRRAIASPISSHIAPDLISALSQVRHEARVENSGSPDMFSKWKRSTCLKPYP